MIYPFSPTQLAGMDTAGPLTQKIASKGLVNSIRVYNFTPGFWQITNDYNVVIDIVPPWREKIMRVTDSQNYFSTFQTTQPYFQTSAVSNTQYQFGYEFTKSKLMPIEIPLLSTAMVAGSLPAGTATIGAVELAGSLAPRYTIDTLLVDNTPITVAAGAVYYSAHVDLHGLNWAIAGVGGVSGTALNYSIAMLSQMPQLNAAIGGSVIMNSSNAGQAGSSAVSNNGAGLALTMQTPSASSQAAVANNNTSDSLSFTYLEVLGG